jgi:hypothetical protein
VVAEIAEGDELSGRVVESMAQFRRNAVRWTATGEMPFAETRLRDIEFPG